MPHDDLSGAILTIDLDAISANYRQLCKQAPGATTAGVVKANAYGLGLDKVAPVLFDAGCQVFFVATANEGIQLRGLLPEAEINVLNGAPSGLEALFHEHNLIPVLNSLEAVGLWRAFCVAQGQPLPAALQLDTGMARLGLSPNEVDGLAKDTGQLAGFELRTILSHLACASDAEHPLNEEQLLAFKSALDRLPAAKASFAASSGIFLGPQYHFDLVRPGGALYGLCPLTSMPNPRPNPMAQVVRLQGKILQVRDVDTPQTVGYGATHRVTGPSRIATVAAGYADGFLRSLGNFGCGYLGGVRTPIVGRVSMDLITLDVTDIPGEQAHIGALVDLIGPDNPLDQVADTAGTIGYELLTLLGSRYHRIYVGAG
jgi:alanine racemase